jgi:hypothetical protein
MSAEVPIETVDQVLRKFCIEVPRHTEIGNVQIHEEGLKKREASSAERRQFKPR